ncbi:MAG: hypothetical protein RBT37_06005 [Dissulfurispiraceae bacterium]|jgi:hypothetical protein|nr:hypothetical protein [Dissulfurispiraceae bacterium]
MKTGILFRLTSLLTAAMLFAASSSVSGASDASRMFRYALDYSVVIHKDNITGVPVIGYMTTNRGNVPVIVIESEYLDSMVAFAARERGSRSGYQIFISSRFISFVSSNQDWGKDIAAFILYHEMGHVINDDQNVFKPATQDVVTDKSLKESDADRYALERFRQRGYSEDRIKVLYRNVFEEIGRFHTTDPAIGRSVEARMIAALK